MKNVWKWILGILVGLLVVSAIVAVPFMLRNAFGARFAPGFERQSWRMPMHDFDGRGFDRFGPMMGGRGFDRFAPMMGGRDFGGYLPFFGGFMLLGGLLRLVVPLGIVVLIAWLAYQQGKKTGARSPGAAPANPMPDSSPENTPAVQN